MYSFGCISLRWSFFVNLDSCILHKITLSVNWFKFILPAWCPSPLSLFCNELNFGIRWHQVLIILLILHSSLSQTILAFYNFLLLCLFIWVYFVVIFCLWVPFFYWKCCNLSAVTSFFGIITAINEHIIETTPTQRVTGQAETSSFPYSLCITLLKDLETLVEVAAQQFYGDDRKWNFIAATEAIK